MRIYYLVLKILLSSPVLFSSTGVSSNAPSVIFYAGIGEADFGEDPHAVHGIGTSDGGYLVVGKSLDISGSSDAFALKVVPNNWSGYLHLSPPSEASNATWSWSLARGESGKQDGFNQVAEVGSALFLAGFKGMSDGSEDSWLVKVDSSTGGVIWEHTLSESQSGTSSAFEVVHATSQGGLITGGVTEAEKGGLEGFKSYGNPSSGTAFVAYYGPSLVQESSMPSAPTWYQNLSDSLTVKAVRPIGNTGEFMVLTSGVNYPHEAMLKKLDSQGSLLWSKSYPSRGEPTDLCVIKKDGEPQGFAFCGHGGKTSGILDSYLTGLDLNGTIQWSQEFGDPVGGVDKFAGLGAGNPLLIYDESWGIQATDDGGMIVASGTGIEGCQPWQGTDANQTRISILNECQADPRNDWRGMITKFDQNGNMVWQRVDSFLSPEGDATVSSACEYVSITSDGKLLSVNDEAFGVGILVLEAEISSSPNIFSTGGTALSGNWRSSDWFGSYFPTASGWIYHLNHGWIYSLAGSLNSIWFWNEDSGWLWTTQSFYPWTWFHQGQSWKYFNSSNSTWSAGYN